MELHVKISAYPKGKLAGDSGSGAGRRMRQVDEKKTQSKLSCSIPFSETKILNFLMILLRRLAIGRELQVTK